MKTKILAFGLGALFSLACATPPEIKAASKAQLELVDGLDGAVVALQKALNSYQRDKQALMLADVRIQLTQQAIDLVASDERELVSADELFEISGTQVRAWVEGSSDRAALPVRIQEQEAAIERSRARIAVLQDEGQKNREIMLLNAMQMDLDDMRLRLFEVSSIPEELAELEGVLRQGLDSAQRDRHELGQRIGVLRAQVALCKSMARTVDSWLTIDVSVSQAQADSLKESLVSAFEPEVKP